MATYVVGDIHGCYRELRSLLEQVGFKPRRDRLWLVGDLINRGPESLKVLRYVRDLGERAVTVMGNHEVRALAGLLAPGTPPAGFRKFMGYLERVPDRDELVAWLRQLPLLHHDPESGIVMVHAGIHPFWSLAEAFHHAHELKLALHNDHLAPQLLTPDAEEAESPLSKKLESLRYALDVFTRIRLCTPDGALIWPRQAVAAGLAHPYLVPPADSPIRAWFDLRPWQPGERIIHGHWAAAGLRLTPNCISVDSSCVYGGKLTLLRLDNHKFKVSQVGCPEYVSFDE